MRVCAGGRGAELVVRGAATRAVPVEHDADDADHDGHGSRDAQRAGQQLLQAPATRHGALLLRQPAAREHADGRAGEQLRGERDAVEGEIRGGDGEDGPHPGADGGVRGGPSQLRRRQPEFILVAVDGGGAGFERASRRR